VTAVVAGPVVVPSGKVKVNSGSFSSTQPASTGLKLVKKVVSVVPSPLPSLSFK